MAKTWVNLCPGNTTAGPERGSGLEWPEEGEGMGSVWVGVQGQCHGSGAPGEEELKLWTGEGKGWAQAGETDALQQNRGGPAGAGFV